MPAVIQVIDEHTVIQVGENTAAAARDAALAQAWAEGHEPGGPGTKSSKEWAGEAQLSAEQAADLVLPQNVFVAADLATAIANGEAAVAEGTYFKAVGQAEGVSQIRVRTSTGSDLVYEEYTDARVDEVIRKSTNVVPAAFYGASTTATWQENRDAINAAIDAAHAAGGGTVLLPTGNVIVKGIALKSWVKLYGPGNRLIHPDGADGNVIDTVSNETTGSIAKDATILTVTDPSKVEKGAVVRIRGAGGQSQSQQTSLTSSITPSSTELLVDSTDGFLPSGLLLLGDELISYSGVTAASFTGLTRGAFGTTAAAADAGAVVPLAAALYAVALDVDGGVVTLDRPARSGMTGAAVVSGPVGVELDVAVDGAKTTGSHHGVALTLTRLAEISRLRVTRGGQGGLYLSACMDSHIGTLIVSDTGQPMSSMGAGLWLFRGNERIVADYVQVTGDCYHGVYIDDRTQTGVEWDAPNVDNTIRCLCIDIPRQPQNAGWIVVGGSRNRVLGGTIKGVRNGVIVDSNQHYRADGDVQSSRQNLVANVSMVDVFTGVTFRESGQRAENIPCHNVNIPIHNSYRHGSVYSGVGYGFGLPDMVPLDARPVLAGERGAVEFPGALNRHMQIALGTDDQQPPGDLTVAILLQPNAWSDNASLIGKWGSGTDRSYHLQCIGSSLIWGVYLHDSGSAEAVIVSALPTLLPEGVPVWLRATCKFTVADDVILALAWAHPRTVDDPLPAEWTELGTTTLTGRTAPIKVSTNPVTIGGAPGSSSYLAGKVWRAIVHHGGEVAINADFRAKQPDLVFPDMTGKFKWEPRDPLTYAADAAG